MQCDILRDTVARRKLLHWITTSGILAYITGTSSYVVEFYRRPTTASSFLEVIADADYKATHRRSVSGGAVMYGGTCVCWYYRAQRCVTRSTTEAEYVVLGEAVKELLF